jgi:hypothetical protein
MPLLNDLHLWPNGSPMQKEQLPNTEQASARMFTNKLSTGRISQPPLPSGKKLHKKKSVESRSYKVQDLLAHAETSHVTSTPTKLGTNAPTKTPQTTSMSQWTLTLLIYQSRFVNSLTRSKPSTGLRDIVSDAGLRATWLETA